MITAESISCLQTVRPENFAAQFGNLVTEYSCQIPASQSRWLEFFTDPSLLIGGIAAISTVGAVIVALIQSNHAKAVAAQARTDAGKAREDAIAVAEAADSLALKREVRVKELDAYMNLWRKGAYASAHVTSKGEIFGEHQVDHVMALRAFLLYLSVSDPDLEKDFEDTVQFLMAVATVLNQFTNDGSALVQDDVQWVGYENFKTWASNEANHLLEFVDHATEIMGILPDFYRGAKSKIETIERLKEAQNSLQRDYLPLLAWRQARRKK